MMKSSLLAVFVASGAAFAECPASKDHSNTFGNLVRDIQAATSDAQAQPLSNQMWELWLDAPDEQAQQVLDAGMKKRASFDLLGAVTDFDKLVAYCPTYAEGYNQRAFAYFLQQNYELALQDLNVALDLTPQHLGALTGRALTYMGLEDLDAARADIKTALAINPWLGERHLLEKGGPLAIPGDDI